MAQRADLGVASVYANAMTYHAGASPAESFAAQVMYGKMVEASVQRMPPPRSIEARIDSCAWA
jgi:hypothetical protein